ncbi:MAG: hypothetical protein ABI809_10540 [Caldimonas sp.]
MTGIFAAARRLAPLLVAVVAFEEMSRDVTRLQSAIAPTPGLARALLRQSRQEAMHAAVFRGALRLTGIRADCPPRLATGLAQVRLRLQDDLRRGDLGSSMLGLHCVMEGLGSTALQPPAGDLGRLGDRLVPLRALILEQELAHQQLGERWIERMAGERSELRVACQVYVELAEAIVDAGLDAFGGYSADEAAYRIDSAAHLDRMRQRFA